METKDFKRVNPDDYKHIKGWGIDADPQNNPTYPYKHKTNEEHKGYSWERPPQQQVTVEVLKSNERPNLTAVFGTSTPPSGLSGRLRRYAFKYSESDYGHWLPLVLADRIGVFEGIMDDVKNGHFPNFFAERGWTAEWKYNRPNLLKNVAAGLLITAAAVTAISLFRKAKSESWVEKQLSKI